MPAGVVGSTCQVRGAAASLNARVHIAFIIIDHIDDVFVSFCRTGQSLETNVYRGAITAI